MEGRAWSKAAAFFAEQRRRNRWFRTVSAMAAVVVFCTVYALILPAITMERETYCGLNEHTHSEACWELRAAEAELVCSGESLGLHQHSEDCYDEAGELICGYGDFFVHTHNESCYDSQGRLICQVPEIEEHTHDESCYAQRSRLICQETEDLGHTHSAACYVRHRGEMICTLEEDPGHTHGPDCYETERTLVCESEDPEHVHDDSCYEETSVLVCEEEERTGHTHTDDCYAWTEELTCTQEERPAGHIHGDECFEVWEELACDKEEIQLHTHDENCFEDVLDDEGQPTGEQILICPLMEIREHVHDESCFLQPEEGAMEEVLVCGLTEHVHDESCYEPESQVPEMEVPGTAEPVYGCGLEEHTHGEGCYDEDGALTCTLEEHTHDESCLVQEEVQVLTRLTYAGADYTVEVAYGADAALPEGVTLSAEEIAPDSEAYQAYYQQTLDTLAAQQAEGAEQVLFARFFDVQFLLDGEVLEPAAPVSVTITYDEAVETGADVNCQSIHFTEAGAELLEAETECTEEGGTSFTHTQESFSPVGNVMFRSVANETDMGPDSLPVDYYVCIDGQWVCVGTTKTGWYNNWDGKEGWTNYNRDYITVAQAVSILGKYGFTGNEANPSRITAYQQKSGNQNIYSDTDMVTVPKDEANGTKILPLSRNSDHAGYNLYYLPANTEKIGGVASPENLDKSANGFYTVTISDSNGTTIVKSDPIRRGGSFSYTADETPENGWLVVYGDGTSTTVTGSTINLTNITSTVYISPKQANAGSHSVTFKVMVDGQWQEVGSLPYYYSGEVNGSQRAYITSGMAAQFFGDFGYTATTDPGYRFGYSYNDIYTLFYANGSTKTDFCMDVSGGKIQENQVIQLYTSNGTDAQVFRIWDAGNGYSFITPIGNSALYVNVYGYTTGDPSGTQLKLSTATNANSQWRVDTGSDGRTTFWSALAPSDQVIDLLDGNMSKGGVLQTWSSTGGARYWYLEQLYRVSNNTVSERNADGTYNIGLTAESNGDIVCYYMPAETGAAYKDVTESAVGTANSFWSVSVRDDGHAVYSEGELSGMVQYVAPGKGATVTVANADGVLWSCRGVNGEPVTVESSQANGYTTFTITNITQPIEVTATRANPSFTVQYYANIPRFATSGDNALTVIDTSAAGNNGTATLPTNGGNMATKRIYLEKAGGQTEQNAGEKTDLYQVATTIELTRMYADGTFHYEESPGLHYFNKLKDNESYDLKEIWVLKAGKNADSTNRDDWDIYPYSQDTTFTNEAGQAGGNTILICDGAVLRLVSDTTGDDYYNGTTFYDYNIANGKNADGSWNTFKTGINKKENYGTSRNGDRNWESEADIFAFGNQNCGTGMHSYLFDGGTLNKYNSKNSGYSGCTFRLVDGLNTDGTIRYNEWIVAPNLFNEGDAEYKQTYTGSSLTFDRVGDTYTLKSATLNNSNGKRNTIDELQYFFHPSPVNGVIWDGINGPIDSAGKQQNNNIFTNNFWPMDSAAGKTDPLWGEYGNLQYHTKTAKWYNLPDGDDGNAHNWFFGMNFALSFTLTEDYVGPLEYTFFGDDDLWVFLDGKLICDIGGVHSSIGEYVDLRDYLPVGGDKTTGTHTLSFFYTERGASGSTCYMSFTLPSVSSATTARDIGQLQIGKTLGGDATGLGDVDYEFKVELFTSEGGSPLDKTYSYKVTEKPVDASGSIAGLEVLRYGTIKSGGTIKLKNGEAATISGLPAGTYYTVTELSTEGYKTTVNGQEGYITKGTVSNGGTAPANFVNTPFYELPETGGTGTTWYTLGGLGLMAGALLLYIALNRRKEGRDTPC